MKGFNMRHYTAQKYLSGFGIILLFGCVFSTTSIATSIKNPNPPPRLSAADLPKLIERLRGDSIDERMYAVIELRQVDPLSEAMPAILYVIALMERSDEGNQYIRRTRSLAAETLGVLPKTDESIMALVRALDDADPELAYAAKQALPAEILEKWNKDKKVHD